MQKELSQDFIERIKKELSSFAPRAAAIEQQELELSEILKPKEVQEREKTMDFYSPHPKVVEEYYDKVRKLSKSILDQKREYIKDLTESSAYKEIEPWVKDEKYRRFVKYSSHWPLLLTDDGKLIKKEKDEKTKKAEALLETDPEAAANLLIRMGSCHAIWGEERSILKEVFDVVWYSPAELNPHTRYD